MSGEGKSGPSPALVAVCGAIALLALKLFSFLT